MPVWLVRCQSRPRGLGKFHFLGIFLVFFSPKLGVLGGNGGAAMMNFDMMSMTELLNEVYGTIL